MDDNPKVKIFVHETDNGYMGLRKVCMSTLPKTYGQCFFSTPNQTSNVAIDEYDLYTDQYRKASIFARTAMFAEESSEIIIRKAK